MNHLEKFALDLRKLFADENLEEAINFAKDAVLQSYKNGLKKGAERKGEVLDVGDTFERARQELSAIEEFLMKRGKELERRKKDGAATNH